MADEIFKKCFHCKIKLNQHGVDLTGMRFECLEAEPSVCQRCMARTFGIEAYWRVEVESKMEENKI